MSNCWYCDKELTTQDNSEHLGICNDCYKEMFEQSNIIYTNLINKIADLEAKLVEKDLRIEELEGQFAYECECNKEFVACQNENEQLKQQLAEKDKEIEKLKHFKVTIGTMGSNQVDISSTIYTDQSKTEFAIQQLQRAKESVLKIDKTEIKTLENGYSTLYIDRPEVITILDQIIKELEGKCEKKEV